jgi:amino acid transporter
VNLTAVATAFLLPVWTLAGWEGSADLAEETHNPRAVAPKAMMRSVLVSGVAGFAVFAIFAMAIPGSINDTVNSTSANPMVSIFQSHFGAVGADILQVVAFVSMFSCLLANVTVATRTCYALSRDNMLPMSSLLRQVHPKTQTPIYAVLVVAVVAIGVNFLSAGIAAQVEGMVSIVLYVTYGSVLVAALVGDSRGRIPDAPAEFFNVGSRLRLLCIIGILWAITIVACMTLPDGSHTVAMYTIGFEVAAVIWYFLVLRRRFAAGTAGPRERALVEA